MGKRDLFKKSQMEMSFRGKKTGNICKQQRDLSLKEKQNCQERKEGE